MSKEQMREEYSYWYCHNCQEELGDCECGVPVMATEETPSRNGVGQKSK